jgi:hypothetical protein
VSPAGKPVAESAPGSPAAGDVAGPGSRSRHAVPALAADALSWLNGPPPRPGAAHGFPLSRRWLVACFAVFAAYACAMVFTGGNDGAWARWAVAGYALAGIAAWRSRRVGVPLLIALAGGLIAPAIWLVLRAPATPDVVVVTQSARQLLHHGTPYLPTGQLTAVTSYNPYLPAMAVFGLPGAAGLPGLIGDTRLWLIAVSGVLLAASFWVAAPHQAAPHGARPHGARPHGARPHGAAAAASARCRSCLAGGVWGAVFALGSPVLALSLAVGITDAPVIALTCLALACVARRTSAQNPWLLIGAGLAVGVGCALKFTAWPALPVIAAMLAARDGARAAARFAAVSVVTAVVLVAAFAPALLTRPGTLVQNVILFPLGLTRHKTPAASPLPGHVLAGLGSAGHAAALAVLIAAGLAVAAWLVLRPPASVAAAAVRLAVGLALLFGLAPASRFGYFAYPIALLGWLVVARQTRSPASPAPTATAASGANGAGSSPGRLSPTPPPSPPAAAGSAASGPGQPGSAAPQPE